MVSVDFQLDDKCKSPVKGRKEKKGESQATFRQLRRTNTIIEAVRLHKVIHQKKLIINKYFINVVSMSAHQVLQI